MSHSSNPDPVQLNNDESLRILSRALTLSQGSFSLTLAQCDFRHLQQAMIERLQQLCPFDIRCLTLTASTETLYSSIVEELDDEHPAALMVFGLEQVQDLATVLKATNQVREEFRKNFDFPVVLWVDSRVQQALIRSAPDFESWSTTVAFEIQSEAVRRFLSVESDRIFDTLLEVGAGLFLDNRALQIYPGSPLLAELERGQALLQNRGIDMGSLLEGSVEFVLGRAKVADEPASKAHYDRSIEQLRTNDTSAAKERLGCVWHYLGVWWRTYSVQHRAEYTESCVQARSCFQTAIATFESAQREDLVARFTEKLGEVLQRMQDWEGLKELVQKRLRLHKSYPDLFRESRTYGFRAEIALAKAARLAQPEEDGKTLSKAQAETQAKTRQDILTQAKEWAEQALQLLQDASETETIPAAFERETFLDWHHCFLKGWYCFALGRAYKGLGETNQAIQTLEMAKDDVKESYDPPLYIDILKALRELYFEQEDYLKAFDTRQAYRSIQQQYGYRAFVGAGRLQAKKAIANPSLAHVETVGQVSTEIARSGRQQDVERLIGRLQRSDQKLIVLHGQSGVGKSSIIQAGLIPALTPLTFEGREVAVVLQQVYTPWDKRLGNRLLETLRGLEHRSTDEALESSQAILQKIEQTINQNFMAVLILDQFEEFFFVYKDPTDRKLFYQFLRDCLAIPYVKVVLSLREDYLHYLLECNNRLITLNIINNNILDKDILYYLGNFSPDDAKSVIEGLTHQSQFSLEADLVEALVKDLAQELGEVRPIELQVVGNQLQTENITTLEGYEEKGPKEALVGRFLEEIVQDCGSDNEQIAKLVLYLLTDENNTRPLKTRADLELELDIEPGKLDLILQLLVKSRLVFLIPASPDDRYQLVHDYLVPFVREQQSARLIAEIEKEREQRKLTEAKLNNVLRQQLRTARRATFMLGGLAIVITGVATIATIAGLNTYLTTLTTSSAKNTNFERIISALKAAKEWKRLPGSIPETSFRVLSELNQAISKNTDFLYLEGHTGKVNHIEFSDNKLDSDGLVIASSSDDKTIRLWDWNGNQLKVLSGHTQGVTVARFHPSKLRLLSGSEDGTIKLWKYDQQEPLSDTHIAHPGGVNDIHFSSDGQMAVSSGNDNSIKIWSFDGNVLREKSSINNLPNAIITVQFTLDDNAILSGSEYDSLKFWNLDGKPHETLQSIKAYGSTDIRLNRDSKTLITINKYGKTEVWDYQKNQLIKTINAGKDLGIIISSVSNTNYNLANVNYQNKRYIQFPRYGYSILEKGGDVHYLKFSPDDRYLVSVAEDNILKIRDLSSIIFHLGNDDFLIRRIADSSIFAVENQNKIYFYRKIDLSKGINLSRENFIRGELSSLINVSGKLIIPSDRDEVRLWNLNKSEEILTPAYSKKIKKMAYHHESNVFLMVDSENEITLQDVSKKTTKNIFKSSEFVQDIQVSPDGRMAAAILGSKVYFWTIDGDLLGIGKGHYQYVRKLIFSPNSNMAVSIGYDNQINIWNANGELENKYFADDVISEVIISPDSASIAFRTGGDAWKRAVYVWDGKTNPEKISGLIGGNKISFSPDSNYLAMQDLGGDAKVWDLKNKKLHALSLAHVGEINKIIFYSDEKIVFSAGEDNTIRMLDMSNDDSLEIARGHTASVEDISFSSKKQKLISIGLDNIIRIWSIENSKISLENKIDIPNIEGQNIQLPEIRFSEDGSRFACWFRIDTGINSSGNHGYKHIAHIFSDTGKHIKTLSSNHHGYRHSFYMSKTLNSMAFITAQNTIDTFRLKEDKGVILEHNFHSPRHTGWINSVDVSQDGELIVSASEDKTIKLWDGNGHLKDTIQSVEAINSVAVSPDGDSLIFGGDDHKVFEWSEGKVKVVQSYTSEINSVGFKDNAKTIVFASDDSTINFLNLNTQEIDTFSEAYTNSIDSINFHNRGDITALGSGLEDLTLYFTGTRGIWFKGTQLTPIRTIKDFQLNGDRPLETIAVDDGLEIVALGLDALMEKACNRVRSYLKNSSRVDEKDRTLCDGIGNESDE